MPPLHDRIRRVRRAFIAMALIGLLGIVAFSNEFGRAQPTGAYRSFIPPPVLTNGCYPLPSGVSIDFPHQVRRDGDVGGRRHLVIQFDLIDAGTARDRLIRAFSDAGFRRLPGPELRLARPDVGRVAATVTPLDVSDDAIVQGTIELNLPAVPLTSDDPRCRDPYVTKRFPTSLLLEVEE